MLPEGDAEHRVASEERPDVRPLAGPLDHVSLSSDERPVHVFVVGVRLEEPLRVRSDVDRWPLVTFDGRERRGFDLEQQDCVLVRERLRPEDAEAEPTEFAFETPQCLL